MSLWEMYKAKRLGYADDLWTSLIGHRLGGYSWISTDYEQTPYIYRAMPNMSHYYNREIMEEVVGGSVGWNQLFESNHATRQVFGLDLSITNGIATLAGTPNETNANAQFRVSVTNNPVTEGHKIYIATGSQDVLPARLQGSLATGNILNAVDGMVLDLVANISITSGVAYSQVFYPQIFDLTLALGSTIADYVCGLEQSTAGSGVAWLKEHFPKMFGQYNPYDSGSIQSVSGLVSHITKDSDDNVIGSYPLDSTVTLRGKFKLDANNNLYADGDIYPPSGEVQRKWAEVDLGTLDWIKVATVNGHWRFAVATFNDVPMGGSNDVFDGVCAKYIAVTPNDTYSGVTGISNNSANHSLFVCDESYSDATTFKSAMNGVMLAYKKSEVSTETAQPFTKTQKCDSGGTEEFVTSGIVSVGHKSKYAEK